MLQQQGRGRRVLRVACLQGCVQDLEAVDVHRSCRLVGQARRLELRPEVQLTQGAGCPAPKAKAKAAKPEDASAEEATEQTSRPKAKAKAKSKAGAVPPADVAAPDEEAQAHAFAARLSLWQQPGSCFFRAVARQTEAGEEAHAALRRAACALAAEQWETFRDFFVPASREQVVAWADATGSVEKGWPARLSHSCSPERGAGREGLLPCSDGVAPGAPAHHCGDARVCQGEGPHEGVRAAEGGFLAAVARDIRKGEAEEVLHGGQWRFART